MKTLLILGAGTAGTMFANKIIRKLDRHEWKIILVDKDETHYYQPGYLFLPFEINKPEEIIRPKRKFVPAGVEFVLSDIEQIEPGANKVTLTKDNRVIQYDYLIIATGTDIRPEQVEGMLGGGWQQNIFDFYTFDGANKLTNFLKTWKGGRMVVNVAEVPVKCPVAPLEFVFLADWYFTRRGMRDKVEIIYSTPLPGAFTKPVATTLLGNILEEKGIHVEAEFNIGEVNSSNNVIRSWDDREIPYDLLVAIPTNMGDPVIERSGMGDELNYIATNKHTLQSEQWENIWVLGDAANLPTSKAGAVVHYQMDAAIENLLAHMGGRELKASFDGHANCFIESGFNKGLLLDFNYDVEPLPGLFPLPVVGPFKLLGESMFNHWGKLAFGWMYWHIMLKGIDVPFLPNDFSMTGKNAPKLVNLNQTL
ncbi:MAG: NAD(P)/FAD-dependent oxidoreductase [Anaerolineaceae bacterium]|nr:NAD(P)/FAD-dependent oxidoreductase [Anaerolineaceae bacterium]